MEKEKNIVVLEGGIVNSGDLSWADFEKLGNLTVYETTPNDLIVERLKDADIVVINKCRMTDEVMAQLPKLKYIGILATGFDNVDIDAAQKHGITVTNVPAYSTDSVAQTVFAHILNITNHIADYARSVSEGAWQRCPDFSYRLSSIEELAGKTIGIYGFGAIGGKVAEIAHAFGMNVIALTSKTREALPDYVEKVDYDDFFRLSDVISLHAPLAADNRCFINDKTLPMMKPDAILINTARGGLVDENALADALETGRIKAAGLDVVAQEPPRTENRLFGLKNCYVSPHVAWQSSGARKRLVDTAAANIAAFLKGEPQNVVR